MGEEVRQIVAALGYERAQDLVGRSDPSEAATCASSAALPPPIAAASTLR